MDDTVRRHEWESNWFWGPLLNSSAPWKALFDYSNQQRRDRIERNPEKAGEDKMTFEDWHRENIMLMNAGWHLHTDFNEDGPMAHYATKDGERRDTPMPNTEGERG